MCAPLPLQQIEVLWEPSPALVSIANSRIFSSER